MADTAATTPSKSSWADEADDDTPNGADDDVPPPGLTPATPAENEDEFNVDVSKLTVTERAEGEPLGTVDKPEVVIKSNELNPEVENAETEIKKVINAETPYNSAKSFEELEISPALLKGLYNEMKFEKPSKIQAETLPMICRPPFADLIAQAHNGSGKTTCFVLGMLSRVDPAKAVPQALCVCPTRELATQNEEVLLKMAKFTGITCACTASERAGVISTNQEMIRDHVIIGTPGTIKRWMTKDRILSVKEMKILVFDEADHMLDQDGFQDDSVRIIQFIRKVQTNVQILLFSATFNEKVKRFAMRVVPKANQVFVPREKLSLDVIKQYRVKVPNRDAKTAVLKDRIFPAAEKLGQSIIFVRTRESARELHRRLELEGHRCTSIQGGMTHEERDSVIKDFRSGRTKILIATDVLARGFDQAQVTLVVNYDVPVKSTPPFVPEYETYLHRIGRSGRFGRKGAAFNLVCGDREEKSLNMIEQHFNKAIPEVPWDDDTKFEQVLQEAGLA